MLEPFILLPFLPGVQGNGSASQDSVLYQQFLSGEHGMVEGIPNLALAFAIFGPLIVILIIACLVKRYKERKENEVKEIREDSPGPKEEEKVEKKKKGDIFEEIESEMEKHEEHKKKLGLYLKFLATRDGGNIARTNAKRVKKGSDEESETEQDEDERIERAEQQRQHLTEQLKVMLQGNANASRAATLQRQRPAILD